MIPPTTVSALSSTGLPATAVAHEPAWVRNGSSATQKAYSEALAFEQTLVEQLSKSLNPGGESGEGEGGEGSESIGPSVPGAPSGELSSLLPQTFSSSVMGAGGLGLAAQLTHALVPPPTAAQLKATGGVPA